MSKQDLQTSLVPLSGSEPPSLEKLDSLVQNYNTQLTGILDVHAPVCSKTVSIHPDSPWFTSDLRKAKIKSRRLERTYRRTKLLSDYQNFKQQQKSFNSGCYDAHCKFLKM